MRLDAFKHWCIEIQEINYWFYKFSVHCTWQCPLNAYFLKTTKSTEVGKNNNGVSNFSCCVDNIHIYVNHSENGLNLVKMFNISIVTHRN